MRGLCLFAFNFLSLTSTITAFSNFPAKGMPTDSKNFGPFSPVCSHVDLCRGPKATNITHLSNKLVHVNNSAIAYFNLTFLKPARVTEIKINIYQLKDDKNVSLWVYKITEPCKHFMIGALFTKFLSSDDCEVKKGNYMVKIALTDMGYAFLGSTFYYGMYFFKAVALARTGNVFCAVFDTLIKKI